MAPWTGRLLTKLRKLHVVRLLRPEDVQQQQQKQKQQQQQQQVVSTRMYGFATSVGLHQTSSSLPTVDKSAPRSSNQRQSSDGVESFSNSQSVPDSSHGGSNNDVKSAVAAASNRSDESYMSVRKSSSSTASSSSGGGYDSRSAPGWRRKKKTTPRMRISESSKIADVCQLQQLLGTDDQQRLGRRKNVLIKLASVDSGVKRREQQLPEDQEVSVPASCPLRPRPSRRASQVGLVSLAEAPAGAAAKKRKQQATEARSAEEELQVALMLKDKLRHLPSSAVRHNLNRDSRHRRRRRQRQRRSSQPQLESPARQSEVDTSTEVTRTISFSVDRDEAETAGQEAAAEKATRATKATVSVMLDDAASASGSGLSTTATETSVSTGSSCDRASSDHHRRKQQRQRRRQQLKRQLEKTQDKSETTTLRQEQRRQERPRQRRAHFVEPSATNPEPTFSKIIEWSEST